MPDRGLHQELRVYTVLGRSEGSLNQHIKLKHPEVFRGDKDFVVKEYDNEDDDSN